MSAKHFKHALVSWLLLSWQELKARWVCLSLGVVGEGRRPRCMPAVPSIYTAADGS